MQTDTLIIERDEGVVTVTMNRPERKNAASMTMLHELRACIEEVERRPDDRVVVVTGAGGEFCSGADLSDLESPFHPGPMSPVDKMRRVGETALALHRLAKPTIAKVDGVAVGLGFGLALGCDLVVVSDRARLSPIFARRGLSLDFGSSWLLPRLVGLAKAKELAFFADMLDAHQAHALGLANRVVPAGELDGAVDQWARTLANGPTMALSMTKAMLNSAFSVSLAEALEDEARCQSVNFAGQDVPEALAAFREKREARFTGR